MCNCRKFCEAPVCTDQFEISFSAFQEALGLGIGWWLEQLPIYVVICQAQAVFSTGGYFCDGLKCKCDLTHIQRLHSPKIHSSKQGFWYWHLIKYSFSLKTRGCTTAMSFVHQPGSNSHVSNLSGKGLLWLANTFLQGMSKQSVAIPEAYSSFCIPVGYSSM